MNEMSIDILCLQETHRPGSEYYITDGGFLIIFSGSAETDGNETAGVGFLVAPSLRKSTVGFRQQSARMASLKLRVTGGKAVICSAYAPHSGRPVDERKQFYADLGSFLASMSRHGPLLLLGDFNARIHRRYPGEESIIGEYVFGKPAAQYNAASNRSLLTELCNSLKLVIGNTFFEQPAERQVTCYDVGKTAKHAPTPDNFGQIDFVIVPADWKHQLRSVQSDRDKALASHHFLVYADFDIEVPKTSRSPPAKWLD